MSDYQKQIFPVFIAAMRLCISTPEFLTEFDRLAGTNLSMKGGRLDLEIDKATGRLDGDMKKLGDFVQDAFLPYFQVGGEGNGLPQRGL